VFVEPLMMCIIRESGGRTSAVLPTPGWRFMRGRVMLTVETRGRTQTSIYRKATGW
jgi:hypothetical protein